MTGHDLYITFQTVLSLFGALAIIVAGISSITKMLSPFKDLQKQVSDHSDALERGKDRFQRMDDAIEAQNKMQREVCKSLIVIMNHEITGNNIDKLKSQQEELQQFLIDN